MTFVLILPLLLIAVLAAEKYIHQRWIQQIALRISVNGTRGKSSVIRYIVAGYRAAGKRSLGKITGTNPTYLLPDGSSEIIRRRGKPRVQEQLAVVRKAALSGIDFLVAECMAVNPELQIIDSRIICPQVYVITNILDDHREVFGGDLKAYCAAVCNAIPRGARVVVGDRELEPIVSDLLSGRNCEIAVPDELPEVDLPAGVFQANLELAVKVCAVVGIDRAVALRGILDEAGAYEERTCTTVGDLRLVNGLAVNDTDSAGKFLEHWRVTSEREMIFLHTRSDRPLRTRQFADWIAGLEGIDAIILSGSHTWPARRALRRNGISGEKIRSWDRAQSMLVSTGKAAVYGFGNSGQGGLDTWNQLISQVRRS